MNLTAYCKLLLFCIFFGSLDVLSAELLKPVEGGEEKEILIVSGNRRLYYVVRSKELMYEVSGPVRLKFIPRFPAMQPGKRTRHAFKYDLLIDEADTIHVNHKYLRQKGIRSIQHPNHHYTHSGHYTINIPEGRHWVRVLVPENQDYPVLMRAVAKTFELPKGAKKILTPMVHQLSKIVQVGSKEIEYFELKYGAPLQVAVKGPKILRVTSRLLFENWMGDEEAYRLQLKEGKDIFGTYYFSTDRSDKSSLKSNDEIVPGKWRTCEIKLSEGDHIITVKVLEKDKTVLLRFLEFN